MPQAIKHYNGVIYSGVSLNVTTIYTCPANTMAIVLPNCLFIPTYTGGSGGVGFNSSSTSSTYNSGNLSFFSGYQGYPWQVTHNDKYSVRVGLMPHSDVGKIHYSPAFTSNIRNDHYAIAETQGGYSTSNIMKASVVGGSMYRGPSQNYTATPNDMYLGSWVMAAGHKLSVNAITMRVQYDFLILEEAV